MQEQISLEDMIGDLLQVSDESWGYYAFSRDIFNPRVQPEKKAEMTAKATACGEAHAQRLIREYGSRDPWYLAEKLKLKIEFRDACMIGKQILFARYTPPETIEIMEEPVSRATRLVSEEVSIPSRLLRRDVITAALVGHEIFHFIEGLNEQEIYTRKEKVQLWRFMGMECHTPVRALSEIGGMAFTRELNGLNYSPFIFDVLLYYAYDASAAIKIYHDILKCV